MQEDLNRRIAKYVDNMPSLPVSVNRVMEICNDPLASPADHNRVISLDPVLVGRILKLLNSAYYGVGPQVTSLVRAIIMLGINTIKNLTLSAGDTLATATDKPNFNSPAAVASLNFLSRLVSGGAMVQSWAAAAEDFAAESCAMVFNTTGSLGFVSKNAAFNWGVAMLPISAGPALSYGGGGLVMIAGQQPEQEAASWEFMKYMTSAEVSVRWMEASGYFAVRKSAAALESAQKYYAANPQAARAAALLEFTRPQWSTGKYWDVYAIMQLALDNVLIGKKTGAGEALTRAQADAEALFRQLKQ